VRFATATSATAALDTNSRQLAVYASHSSSNPASGTPIIGDSPLSQGGTCHP
jgi:hypothetical protein